MKETQKQHTKEISDFSSNTALFESVCEGIIFVDKDGLIQKINKSALKLFGYSKRELQGKPVEILIPNHLKKQHLSDRNKFSRAPEQRRMGMGRDLTGMRKDGTKIPLEISLSPVDTPAGSFTICFIIDITKRKEAEDALRKEKERLHQYLNIAAVIMLVINKDETISFLNKKGCELLGYDQANIIGKNWFDLFIPARYRNKMRKEFHAIFEHPELLPGHYKNVIQARNREERMIAWRNTLLKNDDGEIIGIISSGEDITERLQAEKRDKLHQQQLVQADKMATLGILVSGVAHEINNPTSFIMLNGKIFSKVWKDVQPILEKYYEEEGDFTLGGIPFSRAYDKIEQLIHGVSEGAVRIEKIVRSLKDFARQDKGDLNEIVNVNAIVESAIIIVHNLIKKSTDHFRVDYGDNFPELRGNRQQLEQVVINLLTNACQALTSPSQALALKTEYCEDKNLVCITVRDEGSGISKDNLKHIMDPFFTTKQSSGGTGLGLSICYNIVKEHGGVLNFNSEPGKGTTATVMLPLLNDNVANNVTTRR